MYTKIFNEYRNANFIAITKIINMLYKQNNNPLSDKVILKNSIYYNGKEFQDKLFNKNDNGGYGILKENNKEYNLLINSPIEYIPYTHELEWLDYIIKDKVISKLLDDSFKEKILKVLSEFNINGDFIRDSIKIKNESDISKTLDKDIFWKIVQAISSEKIIEYDYTTKEGTLFKDNKSIPLKIEYSVLDGRCWVILYSLKQDRLIKSLLNNFNNIKYLDENIDSNIKEKIADSYKKKEKNLKLIVKNNQNAVERTFYLFSNYEKSAKYIEKDDIHEINIKYYDYDSEEIVLKLLYLGKNVVVTEPQDIIERLVEKIKKSINRYL